MAIKSKCARCGRFVANGESCCGAVKKVKIERRKQDDEFEDKTPDAKSLAEALFGPGGELVEEDVEEEDEDEGQGIRKDNGGSKKERVVKV